MGRGTRIDVSASRPRGQSVSITVRKMDGDTQLKSEILKLVHQEPGIEFRELRRRFDVDEELIDQMEMDDQTIELKHIDRGEEVVMTVHPAPE